MGMEGRGYEEDPGSRIVARARRVGPDVSAPPGPMYGGRGGFGYGRPWRPSRSETKPFFLTSEFFGVVVAIAALAIAAASDDRFDSPLFWVLTTALVAVYLLSRGLAKSGTKSTASDPREQLLHGRRGD